MREVLIDSSVAIAAFRNNAATLQRLGTVQVVLLATVLGELYYGAFRATQTGQQLAYIAGLMAHSIVLDCDSATAQRYGAIKNDLRKMGLPIPENDLWIAASALEQNLPLATRDERHFRRVSGLVVELW